MPHSVSGKCYEFEFHQGRLLSVWLGHWKYIVFIFSQVNIPLILQLLKHGAKPSGKDGNALHLVLLSASLNKESGKEIDLSQMFEEVHSIFLFLERNWNTGLTYFLQSLCSSLKEIDENIDFFLQKKELLVV